MIRLSIVSVSKVVTIAATLVLTAGFAEARRVALVIGNSAYWTAAPLQNPRRDADDLASSLRDLGYEVIPGFDLTRAGMNEILQRFLKRIEGSDAAIIFFAGHGVQIAGRNYLLPVDTELTDAGLTGDPGEAVDELLADMERRTRTSVIILDACRDNPFKVSPERVALSPSPTRLERAAAGGFARMRTGLGSAVIFATQPDNVALDGGGRNSPFTTALLKHIRVPGQDLSGMMIAVRRDVSAETEGRQIPWEHSSLFERFYFSGGTTDQATPLSGEALQQALWESVRHSRERVLVEAFLRRVPSGPQAEAAEALLASLPPDPGTALPKAFVAAARARSLDAAPIGDCDHLARHPDEATPDSPGVALDILQTTAAQAVSVCARALADYPDSPRLGALLARALYARGDREEAAKRFARAAEAGDRRAMASLATLLATGDGVAKDAVLAARWHGAAADLGLVSSMVNLGFMFETGEGVAKSPADAAFWYEKAAEAGHARALYNLAGLTLRGEGVRRNARGAIELYERAAAGGEPAALTALGDAHFEGNGVSADPAKAIEWYRKADDAGETLAAERLGYAFLIGKGVAQNVNEAARLYRKAAEAGHTSGKYGYARMLDEGLGVAADPGEAVLWYRSALAAGETRALVALARMAEAGRGLARSHQEAAAALVRALEVDADGARTDIIDRWQSWRPETRVALQRLLVSRSLITGRPTGALTRQTREALEGLLPSQSTARRRG